MDQRFEILESKLAHLEMTVEELNQIIIDQAKRLDIASLQILNLQNRLKEMADSSQVLPHSPEAERPPHY